MILAKIRVIHILCSSSPRAASVKTLYYNVLQCTTMYYNVPTMYYNVLQCTKMHYEVLQCTYYYVLMYMAVIGLVTP